MDAIISALANAGVAGAVLAWFMVSNVKQMEAQRQAMDRIENAIDRHSRVLLLAVDSLNHLSPLRKTMVEDLKGEIDHALKSNGR